MKSAERDFQSWLAVLAAGEAVAYPTETFYALGVDPLRPGSLERLQKLKGERGNKSYPLLLPDRQSLKNLVAISPAAQRLIEAFWPGPLTLVLPTLEPHPCAAADNTLGVRVSSHPVAQQLLLAYGKPITATSANPTGK